MFTTRLRALSVFAVLAAAGSGLLLAQSPQAVGTWVGVGAADNPFGNGAHVDVGDGHTLIVGGTAPDGADTNLVASFDAATNHFAIAGTLLSARTGHTATLLKDGRVLVTGGTTDSLVSTDIELFDPSTGASTLVAQMAEPRRGHVAALLQNGSVMIAGGYTSGDAVLQSAFIFDPATNSVSPTPGGLHVARASASATSLIDGRVVIVGGTDGSNDLASAEIYDPWLQSFSTVSTQLSVPVHGHSAVLLPNNGSVLVAGGTSDGVAQAGAELFLPAEFPDPFSWGVGQFAPTAAMSAARSSAIAGPTATEGYAVVTGGGSNDVERYRFATIKTDKDDYAPGEHALITGTGWQPGEQVTLTFQEDPAVHDDYVLTLTADEQGNISTNEWAPEQHDLNVRFYLMAQGATSRAQTTFTDGNNENTTLTVSCSPNPVVVGSATTCQAQVNNVNSPALNGYPQGSVTFSLTGGLTGSFSPSATCTLAQIGSTLSSSCGGVSFTPSSDVDGNIKATYNRTSNLWGNVNSDFSLTVNAPTPNVTVAVAPASVTEDGAPNLVYTFSRTGSTTSALNGVNFSVTGTASFSTDYTQTGAASFTSSVGTVNFAAGSSTAVVTVNPSTDSTFEPDETVVLTVTSGSGYNVGSPSAATGTITNDDPEPNTTPSVAFTTAPGVANEGDTNTYDFSITDPDVGQIFTFATGFPDCGSGGTLGSSSINSTLKTGTFQCSFPDGPANPTVRVQVQDSFSTPASSNIATVPVVVSNVAPEVVLSGVSSANEGDTKTYTYTVTDPGDPNPTITESCGTGIKTDTPAANSFDCTFLDGPASSMVEVTANDGDPSNNIGSFLIMVNVANVAPTIAISGAANVSEGSPYSLTLGAVTDPGTDTVTNYVVHWGDGFSDTFSSNGGKTHTYLDGPNSYAITVDLIDEDGTYLDRANDLSVTVDNVEPTIVISGAANVDEGSAYSLTLGAVTDPGTDTVSSYIVHWGDGLSNTYSSNGVKTHTYADGHNLYAITVDLIDGDGTFLDQGNAFSVTVDNVEPTIVISGASPVNEGSLYSLTLGAVTDPGTDIVSSYIVHWGDGTTTSYGTIGVKTHAYGDGAPTSYAITVDLVDEDGTFLDQANALSVTVNNVAPSLAAPSPTFTFNPYTGVAGASISFSDPGWLDTVSAVFDWAGVAAAGTPVGVGATPPGPLTGTFTGIHVFTGCVAGAIGVTVSDDDYGSFNYQFAPANTLGVYTVRFMAPIKDGARNIVKLGNVIPVKIKVFDCHGNPVLNRTLTVLLVSGVTAEDIAAGENLTDGTSVSSADTGNQMRLADGHYMFNLATKGLKTGVPFTIIIRDTALPTGSQNIATAAIELKK